MTLEKHQIIALEALRNFQSLNDAVEQEIERIKAAACEGEPVDHDLLRKMAAVQEHYSRIMNSAREYNEVQERHALIAFADAIQDMIIHLHGQRKH